MTNKTYEEKRFTLDPFDTMCGDGEMHYNEWWAPITIEELKESHDYLLIDDKLYEEGILDKYPDWEPTEKDFDKWLAQAIADGDVRVKEV